MENMIKAIALCLFVCLVDGQNSKEKALIAQSSCVGMNNQEGVVYAVPRPCKTTGLIIASRSVKINLWHCKTRKSGKLEKTRKYIFLEMKSRVAT